MYKNNDEQSNDNFWISYADLMAGLLFVFILIIGAIVIKYLYTQTDLQAIKTDLEKEKVALNMSEEELKNRKDQLSLVNEKLQKALEENSTLAFDIAKTKKMYEKLQNTNKELTKSEYILQVSLQDALKQVDFTNVELEKLKALLFDYELKLKTETSLKDELLIKIDEKNNFIKLKSDELALLQEKLLEKSKIHQKLVEEFDITKSKIKSLTGIKLTVIEKLKEELGDLINLDSKSGAIKFSSNILFAQGQYKIKDAFKKDLKLILQKYMSALFANPEIKKHIDSIIIEGHTNSDGTYLSNLELSQQRALEVMKFLYSSNIVDKGLLTKYVTASGRSFSDLVLVNGVENKNASRRIEIKFRLKNEAAIKEIQNYLDNE
ncbi:MAG: OmpA family protein [Sulfurovum sp.]|jgi:chemotaxis protein MotB